MNDKKASRRAEKLVVASPFVLLGDVRNLTAGLHQGKPDDGSNVHGNNRKNPSVEDERMPSGDRVRP